MSQKLYSIGVTIYATAYVRAESEDEALETAKRFEGDFLELKGYPIDGRAYETVIEGDMDVTLSPGMTVGPVDSEGVEECVYDPDDEPSETQQGLIPIPDGYAED
jgi:hypothetical protein